MIGKLKFSSPSFSFQVRASLHTLSTAGESVTNFCLREMEHWLVKSVDVFTSDLWLTYLVLETYFRVSRISLTSNHGIFNRIFDILQICTVIIPLTLPCERVPQQMNYER